jgi:MoaA/NifB/PqqE/SkfB family radical SAM enzyme
MAIRILRTALLIFTVMLSSALFFVSLAISANVEKMFMERIKQFVGTAEIMIYPNEDSPARFFKINSAQQFAGRTDFIVGAIQAGAVSKLNGEKEINFNILGIDLDDAQAMNPFILNSEEDLRPFEGKKLIPEEGCSVPSTYCAITANGWIFSCWQNSPLGNIKNTSIKEALSSKSQKEFVESAMKGKCAGCLSSCYAEVHN